ncbi:TPA: hypothetical protein QEF71_002287 [Stenotrophomonas maltophilia]|nr:hypothetical protein [Stenotrophomonas maltophilia]
MTTDKKPLADVKPSLHPVVKLRDWLPPLPFTHYNACGDGSEPLYTAGQMRDYALAALSAQPSPGGQGWPFVESPADFSERMVQALRKFDMLGAVRHVLIENPPALAARQPVGDHLAQDRKMVSQPVGVPAAWMHTHKATGRVEFGLSPMYDCDFNAVQWDSVALYAAPAQAVDLGAMPEGWRLSKKETCYQLSHGNEIIGNLVGPDAEENAAIIARILDGQAVGNGQPELPA